MLVSFRFVQRHYSEVSSLYVACFCFPTPKSYSKTKCSVAAYMAPPACTPICHAPMLRAPCHAMARASTRSFSCMLYCLAPARCSQTLLYPYGMRSTTVACAVLSLCRALDRPELTEKAQLCSCPVITTESYDGTDSAERKSVHMCNNYVLVCRASDATRCR